MRDGVDRLPLSGFPHHARHEPRVPDHAADRHAGQQVIQQRPVGDHTDFEVAVTMERYSFVRPEDVPESMAPMTV